MRRLDDKDDRVAVPTLEHPVRLTGTDNDHLAALPHDRRPERADPDRQPVPVDELVRDRGRHPHEFTDLTYCLWVVAYILGYSLTVAEVVKAAV